MASLFVGRNSDSGQSHLVQEAISFPLPAPNALTASVVNFAPGSAVGNDDDSDCTGSITNPTAPPGKVCLYEGGGSNATTAQGYVSGPGFVNGRLGFEVLVNGSGDVSLSGAWAYTCRSLCLLAKGCLVRLKKIGLREPVNDQVDHRGEPK